MVTLLMMKLAAKLSPKLRDRLKLVEANTLKIQCAPSNENDSDNDKALPHRKRDPKDGA
jgi:hypothetical protein